MVRIKVGSPVALVAGLAVIATFGWLVVVSKLGVPWGVALPLSLIFGAAVLAWQVGTRGGYLVAGAFAVVGVAALFVYAAFA